MKRSAHKRRARFVKQLSRLLFEQLESRVLLAADFPGLEDTKHFSGPGAAEELAGLGGTRFEPVNLKQHHLLEPDVFLSDVTMGDPLEIALDYLRTNV